MQDSLGHVSWTKLAATAGVRDTAALSRCMTSTDIEPILASDSVAASRLKLIGTPKILVNQWKFDGIPGNDSLQAEIRQILSSSK